MSQAREELLRQVRAAEDPSPADEERVLRALQSALAAGQVTPVSEHVEAALGAQPSPLASLGLSGVKLAGAALTLASIVAVVVLVQQPGPEPSPPASAAAPQVRTPAPAPARPEVDAAAAQSAPVPAAEVPAQRGGGANGAASTQRVRRATRGDQPPPAAQDDARLQADLARLRRIQAALRRKDGASALAELEGRPQASSVLQAELEAARILALCLLERDAEARTAAARFALEHPASPQRAAIDASCANRTRNQAP